VGLLNFTANEIRMMHILFIYRGSIHQYITRFFYRKNVLTTSNEKYIYNLLNKLIKKKVVTSKIVNYKTGELKFYYLTQNGLEKTKEVLNIEIGAHGTGVLPHNEETEYWDIPYQFYKPPLKQVEHFLMTQEFYLEIEIKSELISANTTYKTAHYSSIGFKIGGDLMRLRPDSMMTISNEVFAVEIDRSTEWSKQLKEKFVGYKLFFESLKLSNHPYPFKKILFLTKSDVPVRAFKRRILTLNSVFYEVFGKESEFELMHCPINYLKDLPTILEVETYYKTKNITH